MRLWLGRHPRGGSLWLALALLPVVGCGGADSRAGAGAPVDAGHCNDLPLVHGDPGIVVGTHWSSDRHHWGDTVTVYACADPRLHGTVRLSATDSRIRIRLDLVRLGTSDRGVHPFEVTPARGASGRLLLRVDGSASFQGNVTGPGVQADADGWHFVVPQQQ